MSIGFNSNLPFNTNSNFSVLSRTPNSIPAGFSIWTQPSRLTSQELATTYANSAFTPNDQGNWDPWGLSNSQIIDDDSPQIQQEETLGTGPELAGVAAGATEAEEVIGGTTAAAEAISSSTPWGLALIANQQLGSVVSQAQISGLQQQQNSDYSQNLNQHGLNVQLNADLIRSQQENSISKQQVGGSIGSLFGPIGAIVGQAIAGYNSVNQSQLQTAASAEGWINPQSDNVVASQTTAGGVGEQTQVDNVDTTNT